MAKIHQFFDFLEKQGGSDLHLSTGLSPSIRVKGELLKIREDVVQPNELEALAKEITAAQHWEQFLAMGDVDFLYEYPGRSRLRANLFRQRRGMGAVFRLIRNKIPTLSDLSVPKKLMHFTRIQRGLVLFTGPTGCGKTTTLAGLLHEINLTRKCRIITIEDPIEFIHENKMALISQREVGLHTLTYADALRAAAREDPDILLVGELRDLETIELVLLCAEMGFLIFSTLHTNSAADTIDRLVDVFPPGQQEQVRIMLAESLAGVISQQLLRRVDGLGVVPICEILVGTPALANLIREGKTSQVPSLMQSGRSLGMITMDQALQEHLAAQIIDPWDALECATEKSAFVRYLKVDEAQQIPLAWR